MHEQLEEISKRTVGLPGVSIVVPVHNEARNIAALLNEIHAVMNECALGSYEVVIVDDGSTDETVEVLSKESKALPRLSVIRHATNFGKSAALVSGVSASRYASVVTLDGDGQDVPSDLTVMLEALHESEWGTPVLIAGRRLERNDSLSKRRYSWFMNRITAWVLQHEVMDKGCGLKAFYRNDFLVLPRFDNMHRFLPALFLMIGGVVRVVGVRHRPRMYGESHYRNSTRLKESLLDIPGIYWLRVRHSTFRHVRYLSR